LGVCPDVRRQGSKPNHRDIETPITYAQVTAPVVLSVTLAVSTSATGAFIENVVTKAAEARGLVDARKDDLEVAQRARLRVVEQARREALRRGGGEVHVERHVAAVFQRRDVGLESGGVLARRLDRIQREAEERHVLDAGDRGEDFRSSTISDFHQSSRGCICGRHIVYFPSTAYAV